MSGPSDLMVSDCSGYAQLVYRRSGFDCEILLIANCEFLHNSQSKESQLKEYAMNITRITTPQALARSSARAFLHVHPSH